MASFRQLGLTLLFLTAGEAAFSQAGLDDRAGKPPTLLSQMERKTCSASNGGGEIVVCGKRDMGERYRLPLRNEGFDPDGPVESVSRERHRLLEPGDAGIGSCSTVGPGGWTGCFFQTVKRRQEQKAGR